MSQSLMNAGVKFRGTVLSMLFFVALLVGSSINVSAEGMTGIPPVEKPLPTPPGGQLSAPTTADGSGLELMDILQSAWEDFLLMVNAL